MEQFDLIFLRLHLLNSQAIADSCFPLKGDFKQTSKVGGCLLELDNNSRGFLQGNFETYDFELPMVQNVKNDLWSME